MAKTWLELKQSRKPHICGIRGLRVNGKPHFLCSVISSNSFQNKMTVSTDLMIIMNWKSLCSRNVFRKQNLDKLFVGKLHYSEAVAQRCSVKKLFLEISQNSRENTCVRVSFLIKLQASGLQLY